MKKGWMIGVLVVGALFLGFFAIRSYLPEAPADTIAQDGALSQKGTSGGTPNVGTENIAVQVVQPQRQDMTYAVTLPGNVAPLAQTTIYAKVAGYIKSIRHDKGDWVKKGELLAVIDDPELNAQYQKATADYEIKKLTHRRLSNVWKGNPDVVAEQDVDVAKAAAEGARGSMEQLKAMLQYVEIRAPFSGVLTARFVDAGTLVQAATASATAATPLFTLMDIDTVRVYVNVPQVDVPLVREGQPVMLKIDELPAKTFHGTITRSTVALDATTRTMLVESDIPNPEHLLHPGMFAYVTLSLKQHANALALPVQTVIKDQSGKFVFLVEQDKAMKRPIKTGIETAGWVEVTDGLSGHEDVVILGKTRLVEGQSLNPSPYNLPAGTHAVQPR
ncbi:MAG: efflux RND transporter periplasmic adaptor subunit [Nitrospiraceae bacterium]